MGYIYIYFADSMCKLNYRSNSTRREKATFMSQHQINIPEQMKKCHTAEKVMLQTRRSPIFPEDAQRPHASQVVILMGIGIAFSFPPASLPVLWLMTSLASELAVKRTRGECHFKLDGAVHIWCPKIWWGKRPLAMNYYRCNSSSKLSLHDIKGVSMRNRNSFLKLRCLEFYIAFKGMGRLFYFWWLSYSSSL